LPVVLSTEAWPGRLVLVFLVNGGFDARLPLGPFPRIAMSIALITGITGQDGSYLAEFLLRKGYEVHGLVRRISTPNHGRIDHLKSFAAGLGGCLRFHYGDLGDSTSLIRLLNLVKPHEIYNLAAQSHVSVSFDVALATADVTGLGALRMLEAIRESNLRCRFYQASSSEMFGNAAPPLNELTQFHPRSPYACAKVFAHYATVNYRESYGMHAVSGILFNHESPRRGEAFVTRKITRAAARIRAGIQEKLFLGNTGARRDWGFAGDFVEAMWLMLQRDEADDFVVGTGVAHSVQEFVEAAFGYAGLDWRQHLEKDERYLRPADVNHLRADAAKAREVLGWKPAVDFNGLVRMMMDADLELAANEAKQSGAASVR
jgi:GDPmannose 4,6-dehydratase